MVHGSWFMVLSSWFRFYCLAFSVFNFNLNNLVLRARSEGIFEKVCRTGRDRARPYEDHFSCQRCPWNVGPASVPARD
jgi:hypothetical protein